MSDSQEMNLPETKSKREIILASAWEVFAAYGFRRTSMQDIADKAGISRPALYLEFSNKSDIFRGLAKSVFQQNLVEVEEIFQSNQPLHDKLLKALIISFAEFHQKIENTPHGEELLSVKTELASDIYLDWLDDMKLAISNGIIATQTSSTGKSKNPELSAEEIADIIVNTMHGSKSRNPSEAGLKKRANSVVTLVMAALE